MTDLALIASLKTCLSRLLPHYPVKVAYLFGSAASGNATLLSDVDIALVLPDDRAAPGNQLALELELAE